MKIALSIMMCLLLVLTLFYPVGIFVSAHFGYTLRLLSVSAFSIAIAVLSIGIVVLDAVFRNKVKNIVLCVLLSLAAPLSLISGAIYFITCHKAVVIASVIVSIGCSCYLTAKHARPLALKIVALVLSGFMILPLGFISLLVLLFGNFGENTVVQTINSPCGDYYAQVIDSDQGALGGNTFVEVYTKNSIDMFFFQIEKNPQRVYSGDYGEYKSMQIYWKDDGCLVINDVSYQIG